MVELIYNAVRVSASDAVSPGCTEDGYVSPTDLVVHSSSREGDVAKFREDWKAAPGYIRGLCIGSLCLGALLLAFLLTTERWSYLSWLHDSAYGSNLLSAVVGVLFGVPFTVFFLDVLSKDQAERSEKRAILSTAGRAAADYHRTVWGFLPTAGPSADAAVTIVVAKAEHFYTEAVTRTLSIRNPPLGPEVSPSTDVWQRAAAAAAAFRDAVYAETDLRTSRQASEWARKVEAEWRFLERGLRIRLIAAGCPWLDPDTAQAISRDLDILTGPDAKCLKETRRAIHPLSGNTARTLADFHTLASCATKARTWAHALKTLTESSRRPTDLWPAAGGRAAVGD
ncbi:hypothetical protein [Streptomyces sp. SID14515]|uniref:hypothetical protein n=1 Tax=Streptomyces sp. SID14515 TaxID=2706074 RepID=UPI0013CB4A45|nr:hypothetical protein [Streptomyces sp. SID14515]NEB39511.1 hypothetical protein [Streptomyces sp. SID14515]